MKTNKISDARLLIGNYIKHTNIKNYGTILQQQINRFIAWQCKK